jgi:transcriptional regulator with XRE-family HTH domain
MPESYGARLRQRREQRQIPLTTIAEQTKIKLSLLEGLERDDVSHWPTGIFRRAFIRAYAHAIGLEPDVVVREFLELYPDPIEIVETVEAVAAGADGETAAGRPPIRLRYVVGSALASLAELWLRAGRAPVPLSDKAEKTSPANVPRAQRALSEPDLVAAARLCTELGRLGDTRGAPPLLQEAATILDAVGLIVWVWDSQANELRPALAHGYSDRVLAQLPSVGRDADNATAAAFRSAQTSVVNGRDQACGAVVAPLMTAEGCMGVLAVEVQNGREQRGSTRALVTIFAAQLARLVGTTLPVEAADRRLA